jgi:hypothetical protein
MNVRELILELVDFPPDMEVMISRDSEGNLINRIECVGDHFVGPSGGLEDEGPLEGTIHGVRRALVIWP